MVDQQMPTYQDLVNALCDFMDGTQDHEIQYQTGLSDENCNFIADVRNSVMNMWEVNGPREFRLNHMDHN